jgi:hypothetical protein
MADISLDDIGYRARQIVERTGRFMADAVRKAPQNYRTLGQILRSMSENSRRNYEDTLRLAPEAARNIKRMMNAPEPAPAPPKRRK